MKKSNIAILITLILSIIISPNVVFSQQGHEDNNPDSQYSIGFVNPNKITGWAFKENIHDVSFTLEKDVNGTWILTDFDVQVSPYFSLGHNPTITAVGVSTGGLNGPYQISFSYTLSYDIILWDDEPQPMSENHFDEMYFDTNTPTTITTNWD